DLLPVLGRADRVAGAGPMPVRADLVALHAAPVLHRVAAGRGDLEEVRAIALVKPQRRLGERGRRAVDVGEMTPEGVGRPVGGLAPQRGLDTLELGHACASCGSCDPAMMSR